MLAIQKGDLFRITSAPLRPRTVEDLIKLSTTENQTSGLHNSYYAGQMRVCHVMRILLAPNVFNPLYILNFFHRIAPRCSFLLHSTVQVYTIQVIYTFLP